MMDTDYTSPIIRHRKPHSTQPPASISRTKNLFIHQEIQIIW